MEGKNYRALGQDCQAVSQVLGQVIIMAIVVLSFSGITLVVFFEEILNSTHVPYTNLQGNINVSDDAIEIFHTGGEAIDVSAINIALNADGQQTEFDSSQFIIKNREGSNSTESTLTIGDCIVISTAEKEISLKSGEPIDISIVHTPSGQMIQKIVLQRVSWEYPEWITPYPYGSVYGSSESSGLLPVELVGEIDDGLFTETPVPKKPESIYQEYEFGVKTNKMKISNPLKLVQLKIIYWSYDDSHNNLTLSIYNGSAWTQIQSNMEEYHSFDDCKNDNITYPITQYVKNTDELEKLRVRFLVIGNAANPSGKTILVDSVGVHVES